MIKVTGLSQQINKAKWHCSSFNIKKQKKTKEKIALRFQVRLKLLVYEGV